MTELEVESYILAVLVHSAAPVVGLDLEGRMHLRCLYLGGC